jgi:hypothetical protein
LAVGAKATPDIDVAVCMKVVTKERTKEGEFDDLPLLAEFVDLLNGQGEIGFHSASLLIALTSKK